VVFFVSGVTPSPLMTESQMDVVMHSNRKVMGKLVWPEEENEMKVEMEEIDFDSQVILLYIIFFLCSYCSLIVLVCV
jgi:hypothetical protein